MSSYLYSSLPLEGDNIRLLRLLPNEDEAAPLQCELRNYSLQKLGIRTHLYEALSYVWGNKLETLPIYVGRDQVFVTVNLHAALLRLRDRSFERNIWVDALCINQESFDERKQQVELMAKIYSKAHCVIVWLGEETEDTEEALEDIRFAANKEFIPRSKKKVLKLLQRPWFQRIWVLQEVAAARHIVMMCGSIEIDGYAFCLGLKSLKFSYTSPEFRNLPSVLYLIERAGLRCRHISISEERFSLNICHLAQLIDMFHTRQASVDHDKVYALLGMSSDDPGKAGLLPNYKIPWKKLFHQLITFILGKDVSVETFDGSQKAVITSKGCILGKVSRISDDRQKVVVISTNAAWKLGYTWEWTLQATAKSIREHDIVCLLQGASKPTIIRLYKDHFVVVIIAATPLLLRKDRNLGRGLSESITHFPRDFLLVWDWESPPGESQDQEEDENVTEMNGQVLDHSKAEFGDYLDKTSRTWDVALILGDLEDYRAKEKLWEAIQGHALALRKEHPHKLEGQYGQTMLTWAASNGYEEEVSRLLEKASVDPDLKDSQYGRTPLSWAAEKGHVAIAELLLKTGKVEVNSKDESGRTPLSWAAEQGHMPMVMLLGKTGQVEADSRDKSGPAPLLLAAKKGHIAIVEKLLHMGHVKDDRAVLWWAVNKGDTAIMKLLLDASEAELDSKDQDERTPLWLAANNGHIDIVELLLKTGLVEVDSKDMYGVTPLWMAAGERHTAIVELLLKTGQVDVDFRDLYGETPLSRAVGTGCITIVELLLKTSQVEVDSKDLYGRTPLWQAVTRGHIAIVELLLKTGQVNVDAKDKEGRTPLSWASEKGHIDIIELLLKTGEVEVDSKDKNGRTPLSWAAKEGYATVAKLLQSNIK